MAKQKGIMKIEGTIGDIVFFKTKDGFMARENVTVSANRIATDPAYQRTRENNSEFGRAGKAGKTFRNAIRPLLMNAKDGKVTSRLTKEMMRVLKTDSISPRGQRSVAKGQLQFLQGFDFNIDAILGATLFAAYTVSVDRASGNCSVSMDGFSPAGLIVAPQGATHFNIVSMAAAIDFDNEASSAAVSETGFQPWSEAPLNAINLVNALAPGEAKPVFVLLGIQFSQEVNGQLYPLKNGTFNALSLVKVDYTL